MDIAQSVKQVQQSLHSLLPFQPPLKPNRTFFSRNLLPSLPSQWKKISTSGNRSLQAIERKKIHLPDSLESMYLDMKDPCYVKFGRNTLIIGSTGSSRDELWTMSCIVYNEETGIVHGSWGIELKGLEGDLSHMCAAGVIEDGVVLRMFLQEDFMSGKGRVYMLSSVDGGRTFYSEGIVLEPLFELGESGLYDPHPAFITNQFGEQLCCITYTSCTRARYGSLSVAIADSWQGPYTRKTILENNQVAFHNQESDPDYEWCMEGPQLIQLPSGKILLSFVSFLPSDQASRGNRQRVSFAMADTLEGEFIPLGVALQPTHDFWESGETGHASGYIQSIQKKPMLRLFYQGRPKPGDASYTPWRWGEALFSVTDLERLYKETKKKRS